MGRFIRNSGRNCFRPGIFFRWKRKPFIRRRPVFLSPLAAVLPWSDSFLGEWKGGFLKAVLPRTGRLDYVGNKVVAVALSGFLTWLLAGVLISFGYFVVFFPMEHQGSFPVEEGREFLYILLRLGLLGGISVSTLGGAACGCLPVGIPGLGPAFCGLLFLHDSPRPVFCSGLLALPAPVDRGERRLGRGKAGTVAVSAGVFAGGDGSPRHGAVSEG